MRSALVLVAALLASPALAGPETGVWAENPEACRNHVLQRRPDLLSLGPGGFERWRETCRFAEGAVAAGGWTVETATCRIYEGGDYQQRFSWRLITDRYLVTALGTNEIKAWRRCTDAEGWGAQFEETAGRVTPAAAYGFAAGLVAEAARLCPDLDEDALGVKALLADAALGAPEADDPTAAIDRGAATLRARAEAAGDRPGFCRALFDGYGEHGSVTPGLLRPKR